MRYLLPLTLLLLCACPPSSGGGRGGGGSDDDDAFEPNDSPDEAADAWCDSPIEGTAADPDWYAVEVSEAGPVAAQLAWLDADAGLVLRLIAPDGVELSCAPPEGTSATCEGDVGAGIVKLGVIPQDSAAPDYALSVDCEGPGPGDDDDAADDDDATDDDDAVDDDDATVDDDGDGFPAPDDCDDGDPTVYPGAPETCDGQDEDCDGQVDEGFDDDGDGWTSCEGDCDEGDASVNPGQAEIDCNGVDDDCDSSTADGDDFDGDGSEHCFDCDDDDPNRYPGNTEVCEDGIDQDCDGSDEDCPPVSWGGLWATDTVVFSCASDSVSIDFSDVSIVDTNPNIAFTFVGGTQPGTVSGTLGAGDTFSASASIVGLCTEQYTFTGSFTGANSFSALLEAQFVGVCFDCSDQSFVVEGTR